MSVSAPTLIQIVNGSLCNKRKTSVKLTRAEWVTIYKYVCELREQAKEKNDQWVPEFGT